MTKHSIEFIIDSYTEDGCEMVVGSGYHGQSVEKVVEVTKALVDGKQWILMDAGNGVGEMINVNRVFKVRIREHN